MHKGLALRPGSNLSDVTIPPKNASPAFSRRANGSGGRLSKPGCRSTDADWRARRDSNS
jgi:hypothetical protein